MATGVEIGPIAAAEYERLLPLIAAYQRFYGVVEIDEERNRAFFRRFLAPGDGGLLLGARAGDRLVGYACLYWHFGSLEAHETVLMNDLFVEEGWRGRGVGRAIIETTAAVARRRGAPYVEWSTAPDNEAAQRLYDSTGARRSEWISYETAGLRARGQVRARHRLGEAPDGGRCARLRTYGSMDRSTVEIALEPVDRDVPEVLALYADFIREADGPLVYDRESAGLDLDAEIAAGPSAELTPPHGVLLLARVRGEPAGLGGVRHLDTEVAEVKSMYVAPRFRGIGLGRRILARLDGIAAGRGCRAVRLDTSDYLTPAVGLYRSAGYREVPPYNENPKADLWFERSLGREER